MAQLTVCVIFHSCPLAQLLAWLSLSPEGCLPQGRQLLPESESGRALGGRAPDSSGRSLEPFVKTHCNVPYLKEPTFMGCKDPETEGKAT